jgi:photosystem II stability/assembly factor-like uncharacterized protein
MSKRMLRLSLSLVIFLVAALLMQGQGKKKPELEKSPFESLSVEDLKLRAIGPALTSGRISDFAVNLANPSEYYVASSSGGVWKTVNAGTTFEPVFDKEGSYSVGCVAIDPGNPNVVWVGTGENNNQRSVAYGDGIYKSEDGGANWRNMGLKTSEHIGSILTDPRNSDVIVVAAYGPLWRAGGDRGVYKTTDGGKTWTAVLTISENTGVSEVHRDPRNPDILYAVAHQRRRRVFTYIGGGPESGIYRSKDGGETWEKINRGLPEGDLGRIGLTISPANPEFIYAIVEAKDDKGGFYRSTNRGASWERRSGYYTAGNYYQKLAADPRDPERVYAMDVYLQVTDDGGLTWHNLGERAKHVDDHAIWINPQDTEHYRVGCDGGVYESFDRAKTWKFMTNLPVTQFYKIIADDAEPFYNVYGGTQDNYSLGGPSRTLSASGIVSADWFTTQGGDGFESAVDPKNPDIIYAQSQYGGLVRFDKKSGESLGIKPAEPAGANSYRWNWDTPLLVSPHLNTRLYFAANVVFRSDDRGDSWQVVSPDLTRQIDRDTLEVMGRVWPMDAVAKNQSTSPYGTIVALDESPLAEGLIYVGTDDGLIQVTEDGGRTWRRIESFPGVPDRTYVNKVLASQHEKGTVYAAFNNHKSGDFRPYVLKSTDAGKTWTSIASNLPERGSVYTLAEDHLDGNLLFAGTEFGLFFSADGGKTWKALKGGLPTIAVRDLAIQKRENDLVLASFGRGIFILDDYSPLRALNEDFLKREADLLPVKDAWMYIESHPLGTLGSSGKGFQGETYFTAPNPPLGATMTYFLKETILTLREKRREEEKKLFKENKPVPYPSYDEMKKEEEEQKPFLLFEITDEEGHPVRQLRASAKAGLHRIVWDFRYAGLGPTNASEENPAVTSPSGLLAMPGKYRISLAKSVNGVITRLSEPAGFEAKVLKDTTLPAANRAELVAFEKEVSELSRRVNAASSLVRELGLKAASYKAALKGLAAVDVTLQAQVVGMERALQEIRTKLSGDGIMRELDKGTPPGLVQRINGIVYAHWRSTSAPTQTERDVFRIVAQEFEPALQSLKKVDEEDVPKIEKRLEELGAPTTPGRLPDGKKLLP